MDYFLQVRKKYCTSCLIIFSTLLLQSSRITAVSYAHVNVSCLSGDVTYNGSEFDAHYANFCPSVPFEGTMLFLSVLQGCTPLTPQLPWNNSSRTIIVTDRGNCTFIVKVNTARSYGASALVVVDYPGRPSLVEMSGQGLYVPFPAISITSFSGSKLQNSSDCTMKANPTTTDDDDDDHGGQTSLFFLKKETVMYITIAIVGIVLCLYMFGVWRSRVALWNFNAVQRQREREANIDRERALDRVHRLPVVEYTKDIDSLDDDTCVVCMEEIKHGDKLRSLPCKHIFHIPCIDPWLLQQQSVYIYIHVYMYRN